MIEIITSLCILALLALYLDAHFRLRRLEGVEGLERRLVAQAAERAERQGAVEERSREGRRVAPGEAQAALQLAISALKEAMATRAGAADKLEIVGSRSAARKARRQVAAREEALMVLRALLPKPDSDADAPASPPSLEPPTEANP